MLRSDVPPRAARPSSAGRAAARVALCAAPARRDDDPGERDRSDVGVERDDHLPDLRRRRASTRRSSLAVGRTGADSGAVTWAGTFTFHPLRFDNLAIPGNSAGHVVQTSRCASGRYAFYCGIHGGPNGFGMSGVVYVAGPRAALAGQARGRRARRADDARRQRRPTSSRSAAPTATYEFDPEGDGTFLPPTSSTTIQATYPTAGTYRRARARHRRRRARRRGQRLRLRRGSRRRRAAPGRPAALRRPEPPPANPGRRTPTGRDPVRRGRHAARPPEVHQPQARPADRRPRRTGREPPRVRVRVDGRLVKDVAVEGTARADPARAARPARRHRVAVAAGRPDPQQDLPLPGLREADDARAPRACRSCSWRLALLAAPRRRRARPTIPSTVPDQTGADVDDVHLHLLRLPAGERRGRTAPARRPRASRGSGDFAFHPLRFDRIDVAGADDGDTTTRQLALRALRVLLQRPRRARTGAACRARSRSRDRRPCSEPRPRARAGDAGDARRERHRHRRLRQLAQKATYEFDPEGDGSFEPPTTATTRTFTYPRRERSSRASASPTRRAASTRRRPASRSPSAGSDRRPTKRSVAFGSVATLPSAKRCVNRKRGLRITVHDSSGRRAQRALSSTASSSSASPTSAPAPT